jgi:hypothetical protein
MHSFSGMENTYEEEPRPQTTIDRRGSRPSPTLPAAESTERSGVKVPPGIPKRS